MKNRVSKRNTFFLHNKFASFFIPSSFTYSLTPSWKIPLGNFMAFLFFDIFFVWNWKEWMSGKEYNESLYVMTLEFWNYLIEFIKAATSTHTQTQTHKFPPVYSCLLGVDMSSRARTYVYCCVRYFSYIFFSLFCKPEGSAKSIAIGQIKIEIISNPFPMCFGTI